MIQPSTKACLKQKHHTIEQPYLRNTIYTYKFFLDCDDDRCLACPGGIDIDSSQIGSNNRCPEIFQCTDDNSCNNQGTCMENNGTCVCNDKYTGMDCSLKITCALDKVFVGGVCCYEGQVNDLGVCKDTCPPSRPSQIAGVCGRCSLPNVDVGGICCPEGQVNDLGECKEFCIPPRVNNDGSCGK